MAERAEPLRVNLSVLLYVSCEDVFARNAFELTNKHFPWKMPFMSFLFLQSSILYAHSAIEMLGETLVFTNSSYSILTYNVGNNPQVGAGPEGPGPYLSALIALLDNPKYRASVH